MAATSSTPLDPADRRLITATQDGLPLTPDPYGDIARQLGMDATDVRARMRRMLNAGIIRRIGAVPNHYALGLSANGMSVWDVPGSLIGELGRQIGGLDFVSHCYHRPRHRPHWPYNLFAMVHGRSRDEVENKVSRIAAILGDHDRGHLVLYSTRILKKTGIRLAG